MSSAPQVTQVPTMLGYWACPYVQRVWAALNYKGVKFDYVEVDLQNKPDWFLSVSPLGKVPVITYKDDADKVHVVHESLVLLEFVEDQFPGPPLWPKTPVERAYARLIVNRFDAKLAANYGKMMFALKDAKDNEAAQAISKEMSSELDWLESLLSASSGPFILGQDFSNVDAAVLPWIQRHALYDKLRGFQTTKERPHLDKYVATLHSQPFVQDTIVPPSGKKGQAAYEEELFSYASKRFPPHNFYTAAA